MRKQEKKAISLIVLVITIIVMIILAGTVILALSQNGIIGKANEAVDTTNLKQVEQAAMLAWADAYAGGKRTEAELKAAVTDALKDLNTSKYNITVTDKGVTVTAKPGSGDTGDITESEWVTAVTPDGVPIPKGFVASPYGADEAKGIPAENTKAGGLVIYELHDGETAIPSDETQEVSWATRNQYVWVPVADLSVNTLTRQKFYADDNEDWGWITISDKLGAYFWEVTPDTDLTATYNNPELQQCIDEEWGSATECDEWYPETLKAEDYATQRTLDEVTEMYESVETYGGFYIARYETGLLPTATSPTLAAEPSILTGRNNVGSRMHLQPYNYIGWNNDDTENTMLTETGGAVEVARSLYTKTDESFGVESTLTYGAQWDAVVQWYKEKGLDIENSTAYGNYMNNEISYDEINSGAKYAEFNTSKWTLEAFTEVTSNYSKTSSQSHLLTTGALKAANKNNIYDIAGNLIEWTMEGISARGRVLRGGSYFDDGGYYPVSNRYDFGPYGSDVDLFGFRSALYIKK